MSGAKRPRIAVFASGSGTTFQTTAEAVASGVVDFDIELLICDREDAGVLERVADVNRMYGFKIKTVLINKKRYPGGRQPRGQTLDEARATCSTLSEHHIDHLCLMGCERIIGKQVVEEYGWLPEYAKRDPAHKGIYLARMTNTHPGILPATVDTLGLHTQEYVLQLGLKETAQTLHVLSEAVDEGPIIAEHRVRVYPADTPEHLFERVRRVEKAYLPLDIDAFLKDQAAWRSKK